MFTAILALTLASGLYCFFSVIWIKKLNKYTDKLDEVNKNTAAINRIDKTLVSKKGLKFFADKENELFAEGKKLMAEFDELKKKFPWRWL